jgi:hypothetical protein
MLLGAFAAADAGRVGEDGTGAMLVAAELLDALGSARVPGCIHEEVIETAAPQTNGRVVFEWHPATGELSFATDSIQPALTLPEDFSAELLAQTTQSCESR